MNANYDNSFKLGEEYKFVQIAYLCFWLSVGIATFTFPFAFFVYYRILHTKNLESSYIYKLIIVNGIANCFQFYTFMDSIMLGVLPDLNYFFDFLNNNHLVQIYAFPGFVTNGIQTSTSMLVALNRLLSILISEKLRLYDKLFFKGSCIFSVTLSLLVSCPLFLGNCYYDDVTSPTNQTHFVAVLVEMNLIVPWGLFVSSMGTLSNILSLILTFQLVKIRRRQVVNLRADTSNKVEKVEQGLIVSISVSSLLQLFIFVFGVLCAYFQVAAVSVFLSIFMALYTCSSFWQDNGRVRSISSRLHPLIYSEGKTSETPSIILISAIN